MKVYTLSGRSGTGKSFQAINLCKERNIESIIDDGLFIYRNKVISGISAKRERTIIRAVQAAVFDDDDRAEEAKAAIARMKPKSILIIGTSDRMVDKIIERLELPEPEERIYIEEITTDEERVIARKQRKEMGQHVIPAPTFQLKKQFSGYFMKPMKLLKDFNPLEHWKEGAEKSVVRPSYSYMGRYNISEKVMTDIIDCIRQDAESINEIDMVTVKENREMRNEGIELDVAINMNYSEDLPGKAETFQAMIATIIEEMTAFNVNKVNIDVKEVV
ncbi:MAG: hypothetical protein IJJ01_02595 [Firmicutes bacterium]|nr:hypothetical protein [Bacillota bacterium]